MKPRERRYLGALLAESAAGRGRVSEESLLSAARTVGPEYPWYVSARKGTPEEDARGIDVVVKCSEGEIHLQSKSSNARAIDFARTKKGKRVSVVLVALSDEITRARTRSALEEAYMRRERTSE